MSKSKVPVSGFMQKEVITINSDASIGEAVKTMYEKKVGSLIIKDNDELKGMITERDIARSIFIHNVSNDSKIKDIFTTPLVSVEPDSSILDVAEMIGKTQILRIPVIKEGKVLGVISASDLVVLFTMFDNEELEKKFGSFITEP